MFEDRLLIYKFKRGDSAALQRIYEKYHGYLLTLAIGLVNDINTAEDMVHDFFVSFAQSADKLKADGSLKWYLARCVANRAKDRLRMNKRQAVGLEHADYITCKKNSPDHSAICNEEMLQVNNALSELPFEQREVVILHTRGQMKFKAIAKQQNVSIKTVQSRYRYGLDKLRCLLERQV